jgi:peptide subunit release factor 1 (eRF1)
MMNQRTIRDLRARLRESEAPVVSVYAPVGPEMRDALATRVNTTLGEASAPAELVEGVLSDLAEAGRGRTLAVFRTPTVAERLELETELPVTDRQTGRVEARCDDRPYLLPLEMAFATNTRVGLVYVDRERFRLFETFLGHIEEIEHEGRIPHEAYTTTPTPKQVPEADATRDDAHKDRQQDHEAELRDRLYRELAPELAKIADERGFQALLVIGTARNVAAFLDHLPKALADIAVPSSSSLPNPDAAPPAVLDAVADEIAELEASRERSVLEQLQEVGISGLDPVLTALQENRVDTLVLPWDLDGQVYRARSGYVAADLATCQRMDPQGGPPKPARLSDALEELMLRFDPKLSIMTGNRAERLGNEHGGIAALPRW